MLFMLKKTLRRMSEWKYRIKSYDEGEQKWQADDLLRLSSEDVSRMSIKSISKG